MSQHIYVISPSGAVRDPAALRRGVRRLQALGHQVEVDPAALASRQRFAGDDGTRLAAIHRAADSGAGVIMTTRGGYGLTRLLAGIDYRRLSRAVERGCLLLGHSDFGALQTALLARTGAGSWAGPGVCEGFGMPSNQEPDEIMQACFCDLLAGEGEGAGWRQWPQPRPAAPADAPSTAVSSATNSRASSPAPKPVSAEWTTPASVLWGGNLAVLSSLLGTPYFPDIRRGLLFLEDVGEHPYRIERMLTQLLHAGVLARQRAIILGQFTDYKLTPHDRGYTLNSVVAWLRSQLKVPVVTNLPFGHGPTKVMLPIGRKTRLIVSGRDAMLYWG